MTADEQALRERHIQTFGDTIEPDYEAPEPGQGKAWRRTQFCPALDHDAPVSWPCDTARALALLDAARAAIGALVDEANDPTRYGEDDHTEQVGIWVARETWDRLAVHREARP